MIFVSTQVQTNILHKNYWFYLFVLSYKTFWRELSEQNWASLLAETWTRSVHVCNWGDKMQRTLAYFINTFEEDIQLRSYASTDLLEKIFHGWRWIG